MRKFLQFNLWNNCNNGCKFCYNNKLNFSSRDDMISDLKFISKELIELDDIYTEVGIIGGEFFDTQIKDYDINKYFYQMTKNISKLSKLHKFYVATSLIYKIDDLLIPYLNYLKKLKLLEKTLLCTSFDLKYRFKTQSDKYLWESNIIKLHNLYPELKIHVEIIMSGFLIDAIESGNFDLVEFSKKLNVHIDYIEPSCCQGLSKENMISLLPDFFPTRSQFLKFLKIYIIDKQLIKLDDLFNIYLRADVSYYRLSDKSWKIVNNKWIDGVRRVDLNGNNYTVKSYKDSNLSMIDDIEELIK